MVSVKKAEEATQALARTLHERELKREDSLEDDRTSGERGSYNFDQNRYVTPFKRGPSGVSYFEETDTHTIDVMARSNAIPLWHDYCMSLIARCVRDTQNPREEEQNK